MNVICNKKYLSLNIKDLVFALNYNQVILYPTESVFGLGCDPDSECAVKRLLSIKRRSWEKGLILVASHYMQLLHYVDDSVLNSVQRTRVFNTWPGPVTWIFPVRMNTPKWLTGNFSSLAVRLSNFQPIQRLCLYFGKPLVSTSANLSGYSSCKNINNIYSQLGVDLFFMDKSIAGMKSPSEIRDVITGKLIRK